MIGNTIWAMINAAASGVSVHMYIDTGMVFFAVSAPASLAACVIIMILIAKE